MVLALGVQSARRRAGVARRPHPNPAGPARRGQLRSVGPCAVGRPCRTAIPVLSSRTTRRTCTGRLRRPRRPAYAASVVLWPCHCPYRGLLPWRARRPPTALSLAIKAGHRPSRVGAQHCRAAIAAVLVPTVNPWLRPLSPQTRVAPTSTRTPCSSHARWLSRPGRWLAGIRPPTVAAAGLRHARSPALSPPQVSTQTEPAQPLAPPQPLPGRARRRGRRKLPCPRRPQAPRATLQGPRYFRGAGRKLRAYL
jgi:hypothetical protein